MLKHVYIKTYGCQMNIYDSARMADLLELYGYIVTDTARDADLVILNTCHIREKAAEKMYSELGTIRPLKAAKSERGGNMIVAVAGCVAQAEGVEIMRRAPCVDLVLGPQSYHRLPKLIDRALRAGAAGILDTEFPVEPKFDFLPEVTVRQGPTAFLTVQEGCDKFCSFCVVPYTRGAEYSRPVVQILAEARKFVRGGVREITLLGQNVNAYHGEGPDGRRWRLGSLIRRLGELPGLDRIRYTTSHPLDMDEELIGAHRDVSQLMPFLHLPVQSGSDHVLALMNRRHTAADYRYIVEQLRSARPDLALSSDLIVGYPGESENDFQATLDLVEEVRFAQAFSFKYSVRPGTPAASASGQVPEEVKSERLATLQLLLAKQQRAFNEACVGRVLPVLLEKPGRHDGQLVGRSPFLQSVHVAAAADRIGQVVPARISAATVNSLSGSIAEAVPRVSALVPDVAAKELTAGRTQLEFDDNLLLPSLYGERNQHLDRIERQLGVSVTTRGNRLAISGPASAMETAHLALAQLYERLKRGQDVDLPAVEAAIRLAEAEIGDRSLSFWHEKAAFRTRKRRIAARSPGQAAYIKALRENELVFGLGPAGTGKTYLAVAAAVDLLMGGCVERIVLSRPAVEAGERLGFLPGDLREKVDPYLRPIFEALNDMLPADQLARRLGTGEIEVAPIAFMRGRTLSHAFVILDEAQNTTPVQMKMFLTRLGEGSRMVVTGDPTQVDLPAGARSGLAEALETLSGVEGIATVRLTHRDVVRHELVARIVRAYEARGRVAQT